MILLSLSVLGNRVEIHNFVRNMRILHVRTFDTIGQVSFSHDLRKWYAITTGTLCCHCPNWSNAEHSTSSVFRIAACNRTSVKNHRFSVGSFDHIQSIQDLRKKIRTILAQNYEKYHVRRSKSSSHPFFMHIDGKILASMTISLLTSLHEKHERVISKKRGSTTVPMKGKLVLINDALKPRHTWKMGSMN